MRLSLIALPLLCTLVLPACAARAGSPASAADTVEASDDGRPRILDRSRAVRSIWRFYPELLRDAQVTGEVIVDATLTPDGAVSETAVVRSSHHEFDRPARTVVRQLRFTGPSVDGQPVRIRVIFDRPGMSDVTVIG